MPANYTNNPHVMTSARFAAIAKAHDAQTASSHHRWLELAIKSHQSDECLLWPFAVTVKGYGVVSFQGKTLIAPRVSFFFAHGRWPNEIIRHSCDTPACVNPLHLLEGNRSDNARDRNERGRQARGETQGLSKLTSVVVREIRAAYPFCTQKQLAFKYGVDKSLISLIVLREDLASRRLRMQRLSCPLKCRVAETATRIFMMAVMKEPHQVLCVLVKSATDRACRLAAIRFGSDLHRHCGAFHVVQMCFSLRRRSKDF